MSGEEFAAAIREALGGKHAGVPSVAPFANLSLLQILRRDNIRKYGWWFCQKSHDLVRATETRTDTLMTREEVPETIQRSLQELVDSPIEGEQIAIDAKCHRRMKAGLFAAIPFQHFATKLGVKLSSDKDWNQGIPCWNISFKRGTVIRSKSIDEPKLVRVFRENRGKIRLDFSRDMSYAVIKTIYYVSGGLTFKGSTKRDSTVGLAIPAKVVPVEVHLGWTGYTNKEGELVIEENDGGREWAVAIVYVKLLADKKWQPEHRQTLASNVVDSTPLVVSEEAHPVETHEEKELLLGGEPELQPPFARAIRLPDETACVPSADERVASNPVVSPVFPVELGPTVDFSMASILERETISTLVEPPVRPLELHETYTKAIDMEKAANGTKNREARDSEPKTHDDVH